MATPVLVETGTPHRLLGAVAIAAITFSNVCGSPLGIEGAVGAGGAFGCVMMLLAGLAVWAVPQALIVAELSTTFPGDHGGSVRWVEAGLGELAGFVNAAVTQVRDRHHVLWDSLPSTRAPHVCCSSTRYQTCLSIPCLFPVSATKCGCAGQSTRPAIADCCCCPRHSWGPLTWCGRPHTSNVCACWRYRHRSSRQRGRRARSCIGAHPSAAVPW